VITRNGKHPNGVHILDGMPETLVHGAEEGATKLAEAVEIAGARMAKGAEHAGGRASELSGQLKGQASELSGQLRGQASELSGQIKDRVAQAPLDIKDARHSVKDATLSMRGARLGTREKLARSISRSLARVRARLLPSTNAMLKAQLVRTSRELAHESSDLNAAVDSLNRIIKTNQNVAVRGRTRLLGGVALGAALVYHLDAQQGRQRRAASARLLIGIIRGQGGTPPGAL
jgi:hypothetical protein